ncbi:MAG: carbohydrate porin [Bacteroidia bacterium]
MPGFVFSQTKKDEDHFMGLNLNKFDSAQKWSLHFQLTTIRMQHGDFRSVYSGENSLQDTAEAATSLTTTLYLGRKLWKGAAIYFNPEVAGGKGLSYALGLAGAANGETFRIGSPKPKLYVARAFFQQHFALGNKNEYQEANQNQLGENIPSSRITISLGKFSVADFFDENGYSHDPRSEFMNWSLMSNGAWDYAANTRGYTWGGVVEMVNPRYAVRLSSVMVPLYANGPVLDKELDKAHAETIELEKKLKFKNHNGSLKILGFHNVSRAPLYNTAIAGMANGDSSLNRVIQGKKLGTEFTGLKYGFGINFSQELTDNFGIFSRIGWNDGQTSTWAFTEIDQTACLGVSFKGGKIKRPDDVFGCAFVANGLSQPHINYLNAGGYGFIVGDGKLPHYGYEQIVEAFYKLSIANLIWLTLDYQYVVNPAYNKDRGPVNILGVRGHIEF